ncbi:sensor histidine kinase [Actinomadura rupiterrae]|uniref:sensor histidine kinase n=1 Tax=Actinomadura rupiterrae TaxID=559627 RepID=UPI0020A47AB9|nr:sensor histidine kinase [Actinomadura rupiterrae]MCP2340904.1 signal transduction histidine kinase [Actinomadura rupiterrae]
MGGQLGRVRRAIGYLAAGLLTAVPALAGFYLVPLALLFGVLFVALPWLPLMIRPVHALAGIERRRASRFLGREIAAPEPPPPSGSALEDGVRLLRSAATWRELAWLLLHGGYGLIAGIFGTLMLPSALYSLTLPLWWWAAPDGSVSAFVRLHTWGQALTLPFLQVALDLALVVWVVPLLALGEAKLAELLLSPPRRRVTLRERVEELTETRAGALEAHGAELRRIERDLHDGTQAQLVAVALRLGLADRRFDADPAASRALFLQAREGVEEALTQLRTVIRGIYPPILSDRGLAGAVRALAGAQPIPVDLDVPADGLRAPAAVEAAAYFVVAEALTNVAKHAGARGVAVAVHRDGPLLRIRVADDGKGGADEMRGSGLAGIRRRVAALDGATRIDSPEGRGTTLEVDLPCGS